MPENVMKMPALAVVGPDGRIIRSTESFRRRYEDADGVCQRSPELEQVLTGRADLATMSIGDVAVEIEAVTDAAGRRQAMLTLPPAESSRTPEPPVTALRDAVEESPAIVWVKDLDGRYLFANPRYADDLGTSEERLRGNTDAELPETETVDGPRLRYARDGTEEPLQLEYTVPALDHRPALAAFRFALRDETGRPIGTCGVAAPVSEASLARDEAVRLMQLERWNRLDPVDVRAELLEQWHVQAAPPRVAALEAEEPALESAPEPAEPVPDPVPPARSQPVEPISRPTEAIAAPTPAPPPIAAPVPAESSLPERAELLQTDLQLARKWADRAEALQGEVLEAQARERQAESEAQQAKAAAVRAAGDADRWRGELERARTELERAQAEADAARAEAEAARAETEAARGELAAARAQTESLRGPSSAALRLSEELGHAVAAEHERGDELERMLARLRARLTDFESALEANPSSPAHSF